MVSLYLFFRNSQGQDDAYIKKRLWNIFQIFIFWSGIQIIISYLVTHKITRLSWEVIIGLKPNLPWVGDSVLYYLFNLAILVVCALFYQKLNDKYKIILFYIILLICLLYFEFAAITKIKIPYWRIDNFLVYVPIALLIFKDLKKFLALKNYYLIGYIFFSIHDIYLNLAGYYLSKYGRISIVLGALTIFGWIYNLKIRENSYVKKIAKYSLGIYTIHKYWMYIFTVLMKKYEIYLSFLGIKLNIVNLIVAILTVVLTLMSVYLLKSTKLRMFVA